MTATDIALKVLAHLDRSQLVTVFWALEKQLYYQPHLPREPHRQRSHRVRPPHSQAGGACPEASCQEGSQAEICHA